MPFVSHIAFLVSFLVLFPAPIIVDRAAAQGPAKPQANESQTTWSVVSIQLDGKDVDMDGAKQLVTIMGNRVSFSDGKEPMDCIVKLDNKKSPKAVDLIDKEGFVCRGIYECGGDTLKVCLAFGYRRRPN